MFRELSLVDASALAAFDAALPDGETRRSAAEFEGFLKQPAACGYAWVENETLAAYVLFTYAADSADLCHIVTRQGFRGQGLARRLLKLALQHLRALGVSEVFLEVQVGNAAAEGLYDSFGAAQVGLRPGYYPLATGGRADARVLRLFLGA